MRNIRGDDMLKDQYGNKVPNDLVILCGPYGHWTEETLKKVVNAKWYEADGLLCVSAAEVDEPDIDEPVSYAGIRLTKRTKIDKIPHPLKRWSIEDGFYHA